MYQSSTSSIQPEVDGISTGTQSHHNDTKTTTTQLENNVTTATTKLWTDMIVIAVVAITKRQQNNAIATWHPKAVLAAIAAHNDSKLSLTCKTLMSAIKKRPIVWLKQHQCTSTFVLTIGKHEYIKHCCYGGNYVHHMQNAASRQTDYDLATNETSRHTSRWLQGKKGPKESAPWSIRALTPLLQMTWPELGISFH